MVARLAPSSPITALHGVGAVAARNFQRLGIRTIEDLLWHLPFRYEDYRTTTSIADVKIGQQCTVRGRIEAIASRRSFRRRLSLTEAVVRDATGTLQVVWFNQGYLAQTLKVGDDVVLAGTVTNKRRTLQMLSPLYEKVGGSLHTGRLVPIYPSTAGLTQRQLRYFMAGALSALPHLSDALPDTLRAKEGLPSITEALGWIHAPQDEDERDAALQRFKFDELLLYQLRRLRSSAQQGTAAAIPFDVAATKRFVAALPFTLTNGQRRAAWDALQDMESTIPMRRLLEGEVGSGKTVVAAIVALNALAAGKRVLLMAPTEILAQQHFNSFASLLRAEDVPVVLWTHGMSRRALLGTESTLPPRERAALLHSATPLCMIGTQTLLTESLGDVGLVVVDEQHRFGVAQRQRLHVGSSTTTPHLLSLTATPIPRTLALSLLGELAVSALRTLPKGRLPVQTIRVTPERRAITYQEVARALKRGRQAFVVAPAIEPTEGGESRAVTTLVEEVRRLLPHARVGLLHGKMKAAEKEAALGAFAAHHTDVLVATQIVEVGIDVPNATVMIIEAAERFGLAQLHQLRGRVGRGEHQSTCFLIAQTETPLVRKRLEAVQGSTDGFALAKLDLELRGPGDLVGTQQSGFLDFQYASLGDVELIERTAATAKRLLEQDPELTHAPALRERLAVLPAQHRE